MPVLYWIVETEHILGPASETGSMLFGERM
jgi:hypothetical protein